MFTIDTEFKDVLVRDLAPSVNPLHRLNQYGTEALSNTELITLALCLPTLHTADALLSQHSLSDISTMTRDRLASFEGFGLNRAAAFLACVELGKRTQNVWGNGLPRIVNTQDIINQASEIRNLKKEHLLGFFLNARHQLISKTTISIGTLVGTLSHPREIFGPAVGTSAFAVALVHNHPSGDPSPSQEDIRLTQRIRQAGVIMGIELIDHIIVSEFSTYSFKAAGQL